MARTFSQWIGALFLLLGILGFFIHDLFGLMHFDAVHNTVHLVVGLWGLGAARTESSAVGFAKRVGIFYLLLGALGIFVPHMFGLMHVGMSDNLIHLVVGAAATYIGFVMITSLPVPAGKSV